MVHISKGNMKLKNIPNISLVPCKSCDPEAPCKSKCYAMKAYRLYPTVKKAWGENLQAAENNRPEYFAEVFNYLVKHKRTRYFRWHVAGDILNQEYLHGMYLIALAFPTVRFLAFTKKHDLDFRHKPKNLEIVISLWPDWGSNINTYLPVAFMQDGTEWRTTGTEFSCPGSCKNCHVCWHLSELNRNVVFAAH